MTDKQKTAYEWAKSHPDYRSVAAGHARELAGLVDELMTERDTAWISVKDRLPGNERPVLTFIGYRATGIGFITTSAYFCFDPAPHWQWDGLVRDDQRVLFWMPLPEPPKED